ETGFLGNARALLFPIDWEEPFGLVMIEAMACGTPVVAFRRGAVDEVIEQGVTGFIVDTVEEAAEALRRADTLSRVECRARFDRRYTVTRMALDYVTIYRRLLKGPEADDTKGVARRPNAVGNHHGGLLPDAGGR